MSTASRAGGAPGPASGPAPWSSDGEAALRRPANALAEHPSPWVRRRPAAAGTLPGSGNESGPQPRPGWLASMLK
eukprot:13639495-Alexandrium_andersonii.AAC.1